MQTALAPLFEKRLLLKPPKLSIAGVPVDILNAQWWFTLGASPFVVDLQCSDYTANLIYANSGGDKTRFARDIEYEYESTVGKFKGKLKNIFVLERKPVKRLLTNLTLGDPRILWANRIVVGRYNHKRRINELEVVHGSKIDNIFKDYYLYNKLQYFPWSCLDSSTTPPTPWRAIDLLDLFAKRYLGEWNVNSNRVIKSFFGGWKKDGRTVSINSVDWSDAAPDDIIFDGRSLIQAINYLLYLSRTNLAFFPDGKCYFFKTADDDIKKRLPPNFIQYTNRSTNLIYKSRRKRRRPSCYYIYADRVQELPLEYDHARQLELVENYKKEVNKIDKERLVKNQYGRVEYLPQLKGITDTGSSTFVRGRDWKLDNSFDKMNDEEMFDKAELINVAPMPFTTTIDNITYHADEWVPIQILIEAAGITEEIVRDGWYQNIWKKIYWSHRIQSVVVEHPDWKNLDPLIIMEYDKKGQMMQLAIAQNFWKTFMIHPKYRERLLAFDVVRSRVYNRPAGFSVPSPVICNFVDSPTFMSYRKKNAAEKPTNANLDIKEKTIEEILRLTTSPYLIRVVDMTNAFVFQIEQAKDRQDVHYAFTEGTLNKLPPSLPQIDGDNWSQTRKLDWFKLVTLVTVRPAVPNNKLIMHITKVLPTRADKGDENPYEIFQRKEPARYAWKDELESIKDITKTPDNLTLISNISKTEAALKNFEMRDWYVGTMRLHGIHGIEPFGNAAIGWEFNTGECSTIINMSQPPKAGDIYGWAHPIIREFLWRELPKK